MRNDILKPYPFTLKLPDMAAIDIIADLDDDGHTVLDAVTAEKSADFIKDMFIRIRRNDRTGKPREHDGRLVNSHVNWDNGTVQMTVEFSDLYIRMWDVLQAAADFAVKNRVIVVDLGDDATQYAITSQCTF